MDRTFDFHGSTMSIKVLTSESHGKYTILDVIHPPNVGPALHMHPRGREVFFIIEGDYDFVVNGEPIHATAGAVISIPLGIAHRFVTGNNGGRTLIISPPELENYFYKVSQLLQKGKVSWKTEFDIAIQYGQIFLDDKSHWS